MRINSITPTNFKGSIGIYNPSVKNSTYQKIDTKDIVRIENVRAPKAIDVKTKEDITLIVINNKKGQAISEFISVPFNKFLELYRTAAISNVHVEYTNR